MQDRKYKYKLVEGTAILKSVIDGYKKMKLHQKINLKEMKLGLEFDHQVSIFERILAEITDPQQVLILKKDFLDRKDKSFQGFWYFEHMSKTKYYTVKRELVDRLLELLYD